MEDKQFYRITNLQVKEFSKTTNLNTTSNPVITPIAPFENVVEVEEEETQTTDPMGLTSVQITISTKCNSC